MKKIVCLLALVAVLGSFAQADTTNTVTNALGQVITVITDTYGVKSTAITMPNALTGGVQKYMLQPGVQYDAAATTTETSYTPRGVGDILIGNEGSTGKVWIATGITTNDWKPVYNP